MSVSKRIRFFLAEFYIFFVIFFLLLNLGFKNGAFGLLSNGIGNYSNMQLPNESCL